MCLDILKPVSTKKGYGWKVFGVRGGKLYPVYQSLEGVGEKSFPTNVWFRDAGKGKIECKYPKGLHLFFSKREAKDWAMLHLGDAIKKTHYRNVVATGIVNNRKLRAIVAREIYIEDK